jgi:hypothetical protein
MDNPLTKHGDEVWFTQQPTHLTYDAFGPPAAMIRGLFEYLYKADRLILIPHVPPKVTRLEQKDSIRFGTKKVYLSTRGSGHVSRVTVNGNVWTEHTEKDVTLPYELLPEESRVQIGLGVDAPGLSIAAKIVDLNERGEPVKLNAPVRQLYNFYTAMESAQLRNTYEAAHAVLAFRAFRVMDERKRMLADKKLAALPQAAAAAAEKYYADAFTKLYEGLSARILAYRDSADPKRQQIYRMWVSGK